MGMDRREMVKAAAAAILAAPLSAFAFGDSPKTGYFATSPISAPFGDTYGLTGPGLWASMGDEERGIYSRILDSTTASMQKCEVLIGEQSWELAAAVLRNEMNETRKSMKRFAEAYPSATSKDLFKRFKSQLEKADLAISKKEGMTALKSLSAAQSTFGLWKASVNL
ncbi:hypothetical protein T484DRAFT_1634703 [Baffinella frigidus]|nr:hypothetical protein T484DRAFT_1634703 [Cryptophyta sp. CCMP2293]